LLLLIAAWTLPVAAADAPQDQCTILVSIDGLANFYLNDPQADMPAIRDLASKGAQAEGVVTAFPSVTWPAHTTLITGTSPARHGMIGNSYLDRSNGSIVTLLCDPVYDKDQVVRAPTLYDVFHSAGLKTASVIWPATRSARTLDWWVPDMPGDDTWEKYGNPRWLAELREAGVPVDRHGAWVREASGGVQRDWLYIRMAAHVLQVHQPNLLLIHLVEPDHVQHRTGPRSPEAYWCARYANDCIMQLMEAIERSPRKGRTNLFVCSDHGFLTVRKEIRPNVVLKEMGLIKWTDGKITDKNAVCLSQGGSTGLYVLDSSRRDQILLEVRKKLGDIEGVDAVYESPAQVGQPSAQQNPWAPDLWLGAKPNYSFSDSADGSAVVIEKPTVSGTHGFKPDQPDMLAMCVAWGPAIRPGAKLGKISAMDIAPTIAAIHGLKMPAAEGQVLSELIRK
jgi:predicted AlkP superfamily pyrophosphatase or phosphodiesterase